MCLLPSPPTHCGAWGYHESTESSVQHDANERSMKSLHPAYRSGTFALLTAVLLALPVVACARWSAQAANAWYARQPWLIGANYIPASAINPLEMWQADTFDPGRIDTELGWAEAIGMNTMRVFLHDLLWQQDASGFTQRIDTFLRIADRHHIRILFVLFDSVWDPSPHLG